MSILVVALAIVTGAFALLTNRDIFSPGKFYLLSFLIFYSGALDSPQDYQLWFLLLAVLLIGVATVCFETEAASAPAMRARPPPPSSAPRQRNVALWIWLASAPAVAAQVYILRQFDGIEGYINIIGNRVIELRGLGPAKTLIATIVVLNLIYFAVGLTRARSRTWWALYLAHVLIVLAFGILSGSRGSTLTVFATQVFVYHYLRRPVKLAYALSIGTLLLASAMLIGMLRSGIHLDDSGVNADIGSTGQIRAVSTLNLGVYPLEILLNTDGVPLAKGSTLASLVTNVVPRGWWPEKPDTGGVYFTKKYTDDAWDGASNLTPTYLGEGVINFGWTWGLIYFVISSLLLMYAVVRYYKRTRLMLERPRDTAAAVDVVMYILVMWAAVGLMAGEVTSTMQTLVTTQLAPALVMKLLLRASNPRRHAPGSGAQRILDGRAPLH